MKLYCIFDKLPEHDRLLSGLFHWWRTPSGHILFVCEPKQYGKAEKHLQELGGTVFPDLVGGEQIGDALSGHPALAGAGLQAEHTTHKDMRTLAEHFGWRYLDPRG